MNETYSAWVFALRDVHIVLDMNKTHPKRRYYLFSFNLNLYLLTLALENLYFNTLDLEKVQGKSLCCIKSRGDTSPGNCTPTLQGATAEGRKSRMRLASHGLPTPDLACFKCWTKYITLRTFCETQEKFFKQYNILKKKIIIIIK